MAHRHAAEQSASYPVGVTYFGQHPSASGAMVMDQSSEQGSQFWGFEGPCLPQQSFKRAVTSTWGGTTPTTTGAQTSTTTILTSTSVTCLAVGGPAYAPYASSSPQWGPTSVHAMRPAIVSQSVELPGSFLRVWAGPLTRRTEFGNFGTIWGDSSARSCLRPEFDKSQVVSRQEDRAVEPEASNERYLSRNQGVGPAAVPWSNVLSQGWYGTRPKTTALARQMDSAGVEAGPARLPPGHGVPSRDPSAVEVGYGLPSDLGHPGQPSGVHAYPPPRLDVQSSSTSVQSPVLYWDQSIGQWVRAPSVASGLFSFPSTPEARLEGFIAEARGMCQTTNAAVVSQRFWSAIDAAFAGK